MNMIRKIFATRRHSTAAPCQRREAVSAYFHQFRDTATAEQLERVAHRYSRPVRAAGTSLDLQWGFVLAKLSHEADCEISARFIPLGGG